MFWWYKTYFQFILTCIFCSRLSVVLPSVSGVTAMPVVSLYLSSFINFVPQSCRNYVCNMFVTMQVHSINLSILIICVFFLILHEKMVFMSVVLPKVTMQIVIFFWTFGGKIILLYQTNCLCLKQQELCMLTHLLDFRHISIWIYSVSCQWCYHPVSGVTLVFLKFCA